MGTGTIIQVEELVKRYASVIAVNGIHFSVMAGEVFGLLGPNGAGKSTTMKMLTTLIRPTQGTARVCGYDVIKEPVRVREHIGYVSQELTTDLNLTGRENLVFQGHLYHLRSRELLVHIESLLKMVGLEERADHLVKTYSGGMKKRLDIAAGLIHTPRVLFLDEPTLGLDPHARAIIWYHITQLKQQGLTLLLCTNYLDEADQLCDRVAVIDAGQIKAIGAPEMLKKNLGGDVIILKLHNPDKTMEAQFLQAVRALPLVHHVVAAENHLRFVVHSNEEALPRLLKEAALYHLSVQSASYSRPTLDDVFFHYTGHSIVGEPSTLTS
jgi:ABC-2 type transport system ATP-binding protein